MKQSIVEQLLEKAKKNNIKTPELARLLNIPQDRIYKWKSQGSSPRAEDVIKIQAFLNGKESNKVQTEEIDLGAAIKELRATTSAILAVSAEILARVSDRSSAAVRQEVEDMVKSMLNA